MEHTRHLCALGSCAEIVARGVDLVRERMHGIADGNGAAACDAAATMAEAAGAGPVETA